jgi:hypothetical protein
MERIQRYIRQPWVQASFTATIAFAVYVRTLAPTVMWYDMGEFATASYVLGVAHNTGYPLYLLLGKLFTLIPIGDIAYRVNLMSAFFGAMTVFLLYIIVYHLTLRRSAALIAALTIAVTSTLWSNATWAVSYDLNAFLTLLILFLLMKWRASGLISCLYLAVLTFGLSLGNHRLILVMLVPLAYLIWLNQRTGLQRLERRQFLLLGLLFLVGFSVNLYLPIRASQNPPVNWGDPSDLQRFLTMITTGYGRGFINPFESVLSVRFHVRLLSLFPLYEFTVFGLVIAGVGAFDLYKKRSAFLLVSVLVMLFTAVMVSIYGIHNIFNYFQPIYLMIGILFGVGTKVILAFMGEGLYRFKQLRLTILTPERRVLLMSLLILGIPLSLFSRNYHNVDRSQHRDAADFTEFIFNELEQDSIVLADFWSWTPLVYKNVVEGGGSDIEVSSALSVPTLDQDEEISRLLDEGTTVYLAVGSEDSPHLQVGEHRLRLIAPYVIHFYPTHLVPLPEYKDLLVPKGAVYQAIDGEPDIIVDEVPADLQVDANFDDSVILEGFTFDPIFLRPGFSFKAVYYWSLPSETEKDLWVDILFTDEEGNVVTKGGIPIWLHSHWLGGGAYATSEWEAGEIIREEYLGLVPRSVQPGKYFIRAFLYEDALRQNSVPLIGSSSPDEGVLLVTIHVLEATD